MFSSAKKRRTLEKQVSAAENNVLPRLGKGIVPVCLAHRMDAVSKGSLEKAVNRLMDENLGRNTPYKVNPKDFRVQPGRESVMEAVQTQADIMFKWEDHTSYEHPSTLVFSEKKETFLPPGWDSDLPTHCVFQPSVSIYVGVDIL